ncbi:hypothetical protein BH10BAC6_BH10BAC6_03870 [soil metagenome]
MIYAERTSSCINDANLDITFTITDPGSDRPLPAVLLLHGFKGFRNWGFFPIAAQVLASHGMIALRADTSLNGMRGTNDRVVAPEDFARNTISAELQDLHTLVASLPQELGTQWNGTLHIVGHSRGGGLSHVLGRELLGEHQQRMQLGRLVVWNSIAEWQRWTPRQRDSWLAAGHIDMENTRTGQTLQMHSTYLVDVEDNEQRFNIQEASRALIGRLLYIHAEQDVTVSLREIEGLVKVAGCEDRLVTIPQTGHTFGITHPVERITSAFVSVIEQTADWLTQ